MTVFLFIGVFTLIVGILFLIKPSALIRLSELFNQVLATDSKTLRYRISAGLIFIAVGIFFLFMAYYFYRLYYLPGFPF